MDIIQGLKGAVVSGVVPISERVLNDVISRSGAPVTGIRILAGNNIKASVFGLSISATLVRIDPPLDLVIRFNGLFVGKLLSGLSSFIPQATRDREGNLRISLAALPALAGYRRYLQYVQAASVSTQPGTLVVSLTIAIT